MPSFTVSFTISVGYWQAAFVCRDGVTNSSWSLSQNIIVLMMASRDALLCLTALSTQSHQWHFLSLYVIPLSVTFIEYYDTFLLNINICYKWESQCDSLFTFTELWSYCLTLDSFLFPFRQISMLFYNSRIFIF